MKLAQLPHLKAQLVQAATILDIENILDFCKYLENHNAREVFILTNPDRFAFLANHALLQIPSKYYLNLEDYKKAFENNFDKSEDYYDALDQGIKTFEEYEMVIKHGIVDISIVESVRDQGYITGFDTYKKFALERPEIKQFENALALYNFGKDNGYEKFDECMAGLLSGFENANEFRTAVEKGFALAIDYKDAISKGFLDHEEYENAKKQNVQSRNELIQKINLEISYPELPHDQALFLLLLSKLEQGKRVSVNKLKLLLETEIKEYLSVDEKPFEWFKISLLSHDEYTHFLQNNADVAKFGKYDSDGEFFELFQIQNRSIVIDGSNIAHNSKNGKPEKPSIANLLLVIKYLKARGFLDILIIADASLRHKLLDLNRLPELSKEVKYEVAPAGTPADVYLISYVKTKHCLLLSNDAFNQYRLIDPWVAVNIDFYRLTFMITDGVVYMPDLETNLK
jgi:hypothetical protein